MRNETIVLWKESMENSVRVKRIKKKKVKNKTPRLIRLCKDKITVNLN